MQRELKLLSQAAELLKEANELANEEDDYITIRIPKKDDVPIVTIEGRRSDKGL